MLIMIEQALNSYVKEYGEQPIIMVVTPEVREKLINELFGGSIDTYNKTFRLLGMKVVVIPHLLKEGEEFRFMNKMEVEQEIVRERKEMLNKTFNEMFSVTRD